MHNQLMELKGSIRVFCRVRPILDKSSSEDGAVYCLEKGQFVGRRVYLETSSGAIKAFTCDRVFPPGVSQNDIFVEISGLVKSAMDGKKVRCCHWISIYVEAGFESIVGGYEKKGIKDGI
ncbi:kinesin-like protein KIN-14N isoform X2 [Panicum virgatum]|uniref:kinesin-like protein KIN-14N isoform X2 n=1 Tax=Panicum virgatum TaxID=38727 RepID=UPI0019D5D59A|nr:kinesin-like protein KIN-14N isoform X2 [Panicum virgatum]